MIVPRLLPTTEGRTLQIRPCLQGEGVQLGIVGKRGGLVEAAGVALTHIPNLILGVDEVSEVAWAEFHRHPRLEPKFGQLPEEVMACL